MENSNKTNENSILALVADLRSLALFRIFISIIMLNDLFIRFSDLIAHYSDSGINPRHVFLEHAANAWHFSIHMSAGKPYFLVLLFIIHAVFLIALLLGYRTRLSTCVVWFFLVSLNNRNYEILSGADVLLRMAVFWAMFLPLGNYFSIDSALSRNKKDILPTVKSGAVSAYFAQIAIVYFFTALLKTGAEWRVDHTAVYFALRLEEFATPFAYEMLKYPELLKILTVVVLTFEALIPVILLISLRIPLLRILAVFGIIGMHIGFASGLSIGMFPFVGMTTALPLLPTLFWEKIFNLIDFSKTKITIYYDTGCEFCRKLTLILKEILVLKDATLLPSDTSSAIEKTMEDENSWIVDTGKGQKFKFQAMTEVISRSPAFSVFSKLLNVSLIQKIGKSAYECIAGNRSSLSKLTKPLDYTEIRVKPYLALETIIPLFFLTLVFFWNLGGANKAFSFPKILKPVMYVLRLDQKWNMFAAYPRKDNGWYVVPGKLRDGREVDLYTNKSPVTWDKPKLISPMFKNNRWRKLMTNYRKKNKNEQRRQYGKYICRTWNKEHTKNEDKLETFYVYFMRQYNLPDYKESPLKKVQLWRHYCYRKPADWN